MEIKLEELGVVVGVGMIKIQYIKFSKDLINVCVYLKGG